MNRNILLTDIACIVESSQFPHAEWFVVVSDRKKNIFYFNPCWILDRTSYVFIALIKNIYIL